MHMATAGLATIGAAITTSFLLCPAHAQQAPPPLVGERVRATGDFRPLTGRVLEVAGDSLIILVDDEGVTRPVALSQVERLELSLGERSNAITGTWIGAIAGLTAGLGLAAALDYALAAPSEDLEGYGYAIAGAVGTGVGALVGLGIGALIKSELWADVPRERWSVSPGAQGGVEVAFLFAL